MKLHLWAAAMMAAIGCSGTTATAQTRAGELCVVAMDYDPGGTAPEAQIADAVRHCRPGDVVVVSGQRGSRTAASYVAGLLCDYSRFIDVSNDSVGCVFAGVRRANRN
jgi:hypothetical protein